MKRFFLKYSCSIILLALLSPNTLAQEPTKSHKHTPTNETALRNRAKKLHWESIVIDTHNDIPSIIVDTGFDLGQNGDHPDGLEFDALLRNPLPPGAKLKTCTDLRRMRAGGLNTQFFSIWPDPVFVNKKPFEGGGSARRAMDMIDVVYEQCRRHPNDLEMAFSVADIRRITKHGKIAALMGIEGGHAIEDSLATLRMFHRLGVRYMTLTHWNTNDWADSSGDEGNPNIKHHNGLTDFGRDVVREMNRLGMMVDISHVSDKTFYDVIETSRAPVIASHSSARALCDHPRNMTDDMLRAIAKNDGVVMVNFFDGFLDGRKAGLRKRARTVEQELRKQFPNDSRRVEEEMQKWQTANNPGPTPLSMLIDHIDHIVKIAGIDHVGLGSDFDGGISTPEGLQDVSTYPKITFELMKRGYSDQDIKKVLGENLLRVMSKVERVAAQTHVIPK